MMRAALMAKGQVPVWGKDGLRRCWGVLWVCLALGVWLGGCGEQRQPPPDAVSVGVPGAGEDPGTPATGIVVIYEDPAGWRLSLHSSGTAASMILPAAEYAAWNSGNWDPPTLTQRIYPYFQDVFDFFIFVSNNTTKPDGLYYGRSITVQNAIAGLGRSTYDNTPAYRAGGSTQLQSVNHLTREDMVTRGPLLHEIAHRWGNFLLETVVSAHWGFSSIGGQLGGWKHGTLRDLGSGEFQADNGLTGRFGTNANSGNSVPYGQFELYLMGLIGRAEVLDPIRVAKSPMWSDSSQGRFFASGFTDYTIADFPVRIPDETGAQKSFRGMVVMLTTTALTEFEWENLLGDVQSFALQGSDGQATLNNFWEATGGRATLQLDGLDTVRF